jgi:O-antigen ligase
MNRNRAMPSKWILIMGLAFGAGYAMATAELMHTMIWIKMLVFLCLYFILHIRIVGRDPVFLVLSLSVGWLFLCQSPLYLHYYDFLSSGRWFAIGMVGVACLTAGIHGRRKIGLRWIVSFPFLIAMYFILTMIWSINREVTLGRSISIILLGTTVVGMAWYTGNSDVKIQEAMKAVVFPVTLLFWILTPFYGFDTSLLEKGLLRTAGPMLNPNGIGILGAFLGPVAFYLWRAIQKRHIFWLGSFLTCIALVILSGTRSAISAILLAFTFIAITRMHSFSINMLLGAALTFFISVVLLIGEVYGLPKIIQTYLRVESLTIGGGRFEAWNVAWDLLRQRPWTGYGFGTEDMLFEQFGVQFLRHGGAMVHNSYLGLSVQIGILGAVIFFSWMLLTAIKGIRSCLRTRNPLVSMLVGTLVAGLTISLTESWLYSAGNSQSLPFWVLFGILARLLVDRRFTGSGTFVRMPALQGDSGPGDEVKRMCYCSE